MILCLDIGNTQISVGIFKEQVLRQRLSLESSNLSVAKLSEFFESLLERQYLTKDQFLGVAVSSVVSSLDPLVKESCLNVFKKEPFFLNSQIKTGLKFSYENKETLGPDRIANAIAAANIFPKKNLIIMDCGTATTLCVVTKEAEYLGGAILPGIKTAMNSLLEKTSKLPAVPISLPQKIIGRKTEECIQIGLYYGQLSTLKEISSRIKKEYFNGEDVLVLGTGGFSFLFKDKNLFDHMEPNLALFGLRDFLMKQFKFRKETSEIPKKKEKSVSQKILLGVTGSVAAYKALELVRRLKELGAQVRVVMTEGAKAFVTPLSFQALSQEKVYSNLLSYEEEAAMGHIDLAKWADLILIAPATANTMARLNSGFADDLLSTLCLVATAPIAIAPAMNKNMWQNQITQKNIKKLKKRNFIFLGPDQGSQACGDVGYGRMLEVPDIIAQLSRCFLKQIFVGKKVVITAGPTREAIDPVRYLSNRSSGKMGYALAKAAENLGAEVVLISGPCAIRKPKLSKVIMVESCLEMQQEVLRSVNQADLFISCAAVVDYKVAHYKNQKIKKRDGPMNLEFEKNVDILALVASLDEKPYTIGFAAETENLIPYAKKKLESKKCDMIVANLVSSDLVFDRDHSTAWIVQPDKQPEEIPLKSKEELSYDLLNRISEAMEIPEEPKEMFKIRSPEVLFSDILN